MRYHSVFDIIGPVMIGPSSSHTAGAAFISRIARNMFGRQPIFVELKLYGSFAKTYKGHATDVALVAGLLRMDADDPRLRDAFRFAKEAKMKIKIIPMSERATHPNTVKICMKDALGQMEVTGISIGGGKVQITDVNGIKFEQEDEIQTTDRVKGEKTEEIPLHRVDELVTLVEQRNRSIAELVIQRETQIQGTTEVQVRAQMDYRLEVMEKAIARGLKGVKSYSGLTGGDGVKLHQYITSGHGLADYTILDAVSKSVATNEVNAAMGVICATPTAGSAGVVPGLLFALKDRLQATRDQMIDFLFTAGAFGLIVANNASISGAEGGCQAEIGSATGMGAAASVILAGGTALQASQAMAIALKNLLGLVCDPVAGLVEVPCVKRNAAGAALAMVSADMALAGIHSVIPCDEVIAAMHKIGKHMPEAYRETALGGLAATPTAQKLAKKINQSVCKST